MLTGVEANLTLGEAASAIGVSPDTLRRWDRDGKLHTFRDERNRRMVSAEEVAPPEPSAPQRHAPAVSCRPATGWPASCARSRSTG